MNLKTINKTLKAMRDLANSKLDKRGVCVVCAHGNVFATNSYAIVELDSGYDLEYEGAIFGRDIHPDRLKSIMTMKTQSSADEVAMVNPTLLERVLKVFRAAGEHPRIHVMPNQVYLYSAHLRAIVMPERI